MAEDSVEILKRIGVSGQLPFHHRTQGKTSDKTVDTYYADIELGTMEKLFQLCEAALGTRHQRKGTLFLL